MQAFNSFKNLGIVSSCLVLLVLTHVASAGICEENLSTLDLSSRLPNYDFALKRLKSSAPSTAFKTLRELLKSSGSYAERASVMVAFLDRDGADYAAQIAKLRRFKVRRSFNPFSKKPFVRTAASRVIVMGYGIAESDEELASALFDLARDLNQIELRLVLWPRPWANLSNHQSFLQSPSAFVEGAMSDLEKSSRRLASSYDLIRQSAPSFVSPCFEAEPSMVEWADLYPGIISAFAPLAASLALTGEAGHLEYNAISAGYISAILYKPLRDLNPRTIGRGFKSRLKLYYLTSNLVRAVTVASTIASGVFIHDFLFTRSAFQAPPPTRIEFPQVDVPNSQEVEDLQLQIQIHQNTIRNLLAEQRAHPERADLPYRIRTEQSAILSYKNQLKEKGKV